MEVSSREVGSAKARKSEGKKRGKKEKTRFLFEDKLNLSELDAVWLFTAFVFPQRVDNNLMGRFRGHFSLRAALLKVLSS